MRASRVGFAMDRRRPSLTTPERYGRDCASREGLSMTSLCTRSYLEKVTGVSAGPTPTSLCTLRSHFRGSG